ncbi:Crp/Fnr family transcriptional regulator [Coriobacteriia bacterium Es71-Z0120]|uniref:Crp/Fnr family transcriptional regulator n=1 Tax=Parvivirga hydrogeniphila TaxID=2939460 RepID=UPI002260E2BB|nr:Crp/Fnr family transcriptional regulator [Parvivirga hydrogeniphila]MCL4078937.1 Crp/Fnr family transcriptional regulator [Parvivirga hydrogeniphila]
MPEDITLARIRAFPVFAGLSDHDLERLCRLLTYRRYSKGAHIISQDQPGTAMYLLTTGRVKVAIASSQGKELVLDYLEAPAHFGEMSIVDAEPRSADVVAMTDVEVLMLDGRDLAEAVQIQPKLAVSLIGTLSRRVRGLIGRLEDIVFHDAYHRVMRVLLNIATASYESVGVPVIEGFTHAEIASLAGTSRETASRAISMLAREGLVRTKGRKIVVDLIGLKERLDSEPDELD